MKRFKWASIEYSKKQVEPCCEEEEELLWIKEVLGDHSA